MKAVRVVAVAVAIGSVSTGCGEHAEQPTRTAAEPTQVADMPPLPEWAPENPSPEFLRAARVLKPIPPEFLGAFGEAAGPAMQATLARFRRTWTAGYEFFGAMTDEQIDRFVSAKEVRIPVRSLTAKQRAALDNYFDVWREAMAGTGQGMEDLLVELYKEGAREDLSNVGVGFVWGGTKDDPGVNLQFWITRPDGSVATPSSTVASM